ncbi:type II secretion system F family protein [Burkholderia multivorans]|uniref:Type II secretion system F family protein n=1 Tax=Burkholderia multivorans TaxID=87883 RepID=A0AAP2HQ00_9BURK|nr:type II secretion system F family protein [Burkholderia multivorans]MBU9360517.1 type II secretion system F family protein [Burkholderia multivorans]
MKRAKLSWSRRRALYEIAEGLLGEGGQGDKGEKKLIDILRDYQKSLLERDTSSLFRRMWRKNGKAIAALAQIEKAVRDGRSFTAAMGQSLPSMERTILASGERSSNLSAAMRMVLELREMLFDIQWQFASSMAQPVVYIVAVYVFLVVIGAVVVPEYSSFFPAEKWTGWAAVMLGMSKLVSGPALIATVVGFLGAIFGIAWAMPRWTGWGRTFMDRYVFPFSTYQYVNGTMWVVSFAVLLKAGVADKSALSEQMQFGSPWLAARLRPIRDGIVGGKSLSRAMLDAKTDFPSYELIDAIRAREGSENFAEKIELVARKEMKKMRRRFILYSALWGLFVFLLLIGVVVVLQLGVNDLSAGSQAAVGGF